MKIVKITSCTKFTKTVKFIVIRKNINKIYEIYS